MNPLGVRIREVRLNLRLSLSEVAGIAKMADSHVRRIELGDIADLRLTTLKKIADSLGVKVSVLLEGTIYQGETTPASRELLREAR